MTRTDRISWKGVVRRLCTSRRRNEKLEVGHLLRYPTTVVVSALQLPACSRPPLKEGRPGK